MIDAAGAPPPEPARPGPPCCAGWAVLITLLPFEVGMSYYPLMAPSLNFRFRGPGRTYYKTAAQRSLDAAGGQSTIDRNPSGLEFLQEGNGLLLVNEVGFQRASSAKTHQAWFRAGYLRNSTLYANKSPGEPESETTAPTR
jgi:porin